MTGQCIRRPPIDRSAFDHELNRQCVSTYGEHNCNLTFAAREQPPNKSMRIANGDLILARDRWHQDACDDWPFGKLSSNRSCLWGAGRRIVDTPFTWFRNVTCRHVHERDVDPLDCLD